ncbi:phosphoesterase family-domain-containing protein [Limtongia smithiae]|uniref:phosphoesterase family-domain-containing protein n=1 Tax=Limtongia smithiae TaxID=1125753 RepID=UPI0034CE5441
MSSLSSTLLIGLVSALGVVASSKSSSNSKTSPTSQSTSGLADIKHVVYFMQENRAFDHYFGTMAGVRGFKDPNVQINSNNLSIWYQPTDSTEAEYLLPFYLGANASYKAGIQCADGGSNDWTENHDSWNWGAMNGWVTNNSEYAWGHYERSDIPTHFAVAEGWSLADMYSEFVIGPTAPNRAAWITGNLNIGSYLGDPETVGGPYIENWSTDGCEYNGAVPYDCYPLTWNTMPENLEAQNISWFVYRDSDSTNDDPMYYFKNYLDSASNGTLAEKGLSYAGFPLFLEQAANGTLPEVSWIIGSFPLSEHPPNTPTSGAWIIEKTIEAITQGPLAKDTVIFISYDETGGWGDHVPPFLSPNGTAGEWTTDPEDLSNYVPAGPGFRVPFFAISPWTRGGYVFTEPSDHASQLMFLEEWAAAKGKNVTLDTITTWHREHLSNLVNMFDFSNPDYSVPTLANVSWPAYSDGAYVATTICQDDNSGYIQPPVPYGQQNETTALWTESGYKPIRGALTEGRYLVFEQEHSGQKYAITKKTGSSEIQFSTISTNYSDREHRFIVHQIGDAFSTLFYIQSMDGEYLNANGKFYSTTAKASEFTITFTAQKGYAIEVDSTYYAVQPNKYEFSKSTTKSYYNIYSVAYDN